MNDFFVAGGTLRHDSPSYVMRAADEAFFQALLARQFCYVLTSRQMGKSSLMVRTARRLRGEGVKTAVVDLTAIGTAVTAEQWYLGFLTRLSSQLRLRINVQAWWSAQAGLGVVQRFSTFLHDEVLTHLSDPIVLFVDEIDTTLNLPFSDDFFAAVRALYNARASEGVYDRLTFAFLGVALPNDLIKDPQRTPFNVGRDILLQEFSQTDATVLGEQLQRLYPEQGGALFGRVFEWTAGHPYLTQRLCLVLTEASGPTVATVDTAVKQLFLTESAQNEGNIQFVSARLLTHPQKGGLLRLYGRVYRGRDVAEDRQDWLQNQLKLSGLVKGVNGRLEVRNEIYRQVFDGAWLRQHQTVSRSLVMAIMAVMVVLMFGGLLWYDNFFLPQRAAQQADLFRGAVAAPTSAAALSVLLDLDPLVGADLAYRDQAYDLFFTLPDRASQEGVLAAVDEVTVLTRLIPPLYVTLADVDGSDQTRPLLEGMATALAQFPEDETAVLLEQEIALWLQARTFVYGEAYNQALEQYDAALQLNPQNPATLYERAAVYARQGRFVSAAQDLEQVLTLAVAEAGRAAVLPTATTTPLPTIGPLPTSPFRAQTADEVAVAETSAAATMRIDPTVAGSAVSPTVAITSTPLPRPTPSGERVAALFATRNQRLSAVRRLINQYPAFRDALALLSSKTYPNLMQTGLVPSLTARVLYLPFTEEAGATQFQDQSGYDHRMACDGRGCPVAVARGAGVARQFDGVDDVVRTTRYADLEIIGEITIVAWVQPTALDGLRTVVTKGYTRAPSDAEIILRINEGRYEVGAWDGEEHLARFPIPPEDEGRWVHLAGVYDGVAWRLYRDGVLVGETAAALGAIFVDASWSIGARSGGEERFFEGGIDEVLLYNRALSPAEVLALYTNG